MMISFSVATKFKSSYFFNKNIMFYKFRNSMRKYFDSHISTFEALNPKHYYHLSLSSYSINFEFKVYGLSIHGVLQLDHRILFKAVFSYFFGEN